VDKAGRRGHAQQGGDLGAAARLAVNHNAVGIAAEVGDVLVDPLERSDEVHHAAIHRVGVRRAADLGARRHLCSPTVIRIFGSSVQYTGESAGGEASLKLPDLSQVSFLNGAIDGHKLLLIGIASPFLELWQTGPNFSWMIGIVILTVGGLATGSNLTTLHFDLGTPLSNGTYGGDLITITGGSSAISIASRTPSHTRCEIR